MAERWQDQTAQDSCNLCVPFLAWHREPCWGPSTRGIVDRWRSATRSWRGTACWSRDKAFQRKGTRTNTHAHTRTADNIVRTRTHPRIHIAVNRVQTRAHTCALPTVLCGNALIHASLRASTLARTIARTFSSIGYRRAHTRVLPTVSHRNAHTRVTCVWLVPRVWLVCVCDFCVWLVCMTCASCLTCVCVTYVCALCVPHRIADISVVVTSPDPGVYHVALHYKGGSAQQSSPLSEVWKMCADYNRFCWFHSGQTSKAYETDIQLEELLEQQHLRDPVSTPRRFHSVQKRGLLAYSGILWGGRFHGNLSSTANSSISMKMDCARKLEPSTLQVRFPFKVFLGKSFDFDKMNWAWTLAPFLAESFFRKRE